MFRRYNRWHSRFDQPDPSDGSYDHTNPQSFNRYAYVQGDPVNFTDPSGQMNEATGGYCSAMYSSCYGTGGGGYPGTPFDSGSIIFGGYNEVPESIRPALAAFDRWVYIKTTVYRLLHRGLDGATPDEDKAYWAALADLLERILTRPECAELFGGVENALGALDHSQISVGNLGLPTQDSNGDIHIPPDAKTDGTKIIINKFGAFFGNNPPIWGLQGASATALLLGHELGHRTGAYGKYDIDWQQWINKRNTKAVFDACFK